MEEKVNDIAKTICNFLDKLTPFHVHALGLYIKTIHEPNMSAENLNGVQIYTTYDVIMAVTMIQCDTDLDADRKFLILKSIYDIIGGYITIQVASSYFAIKPQIGEFKKWYENKDKLPLIKKF